jgi:hypothetical protein
MMAVFGARLRDLLATSGHAARAVRPAAKSPAGIDKAAAAQRVRQAETPQRLSRRSGPSHVPEMAMSTDSRLESPLGSPGSADHGRVERGASADFERSPYRQQVVPEVGPFLPAETISPHQSSHRNGSPAVTLDTLLTRYFALAAAPAAAGSARRLEAGSRPAPESPAFVPPSERTSPQSPRPRWAAADDARQRWPRELAGANGSRPAARELDSIGGAPEIGSGTRLFSPMPLVATESDPSDLADLMADVLREQALRCGIDVS